MTPESLETVILEIPARIADLAFRIAVPRDWHSAELPAEEVDFSSPGTFFPLLLTAAPWAAVALTVAARPGFENGTLQDWSLFLLDSQGIRPTSFGLAAIGNVKGLAGVGRQQQEGTWLEARFAFFEDGGRLVYLGLLAPEAISAPLDAVWRTAIETFVLERPQGQTVPVGPGLGISPERAAAPEPEPTPAPEAAAPVVPAAPQFTEADLGYYAKSGNLDTLDPEHPINARLRDQGVGFTPNLLESDLEARTARIGAGAMQSVIRVALGWHVIDDGRRTLLLDPAGKIQIHLHVIATEGRSADQILDSIEVEAMQSYPNPECRRFEDQGIWALMVRNILVNNEPVEQVHLLTRWMKDSAMLRARVTSDPESTRFAVNYACHILKSAEYGDPGDEDAEPEKASREQESEPQLADGPEWWKQAQRLERQDRLEEAEVLLRDRIPSLHCAIQIAELYRLRWMRLRASDAEKAGESRRRAANWARTYASWATSGGEGAALSLERDEFLSQLGPEPFE